MRAREFKAARERLGLSQAKLALGQPQAFWGRTSKPPTPGMRARRAGPRRERDHRACDDKENPMSLGRPCLLLLTFCLALAWVAPVAAVPLVTFHDLTDTV